MTLTRSEWLASSLALDEPIDAQFYFHQNSFPEFCLRRFLTARACMSISIRRAEKKKP